MNGFRKRDRNENSQNSGVVNCSLIFQHVNLITKMERTRVILVGVHQMLDIVFGDTKLKNTQSLPCSDCAFIIPIHYVLEIHTALRLIIKYDVYVAH